MKRFVIIISFFVLLSNGFSQDNPPFVCGFDGLNGSGGLFKPSMNNSGEYIRSLIVFVQFQGDQRPNSIWPPNRLPTWANNYMDSSPSSSYSFRSLSDFWDEMSIGNFDFIGTVFPELIILPPESDYRNAQKTYQDANQDVLNKVDDWIPSKGLGSGWNWAPYDN